jgi:hypothetical protein
MNCKKKLIMNKMEYIPVIFTGKVNIKLELISIVDETTLYTTIMTLFD